VFDGYPGMTTAKTITKGNHHSRMLSISKWLAHPAPNRPACSRNRQQFFWLSGAALTVFCIAAAAYLHFRPRPSTLGVTLFASASLVCLSTLCISVFSLRREIEKRKTTQYYLRLAYAALELGNRHLNGILESTPDGIAAVDLELQWVAFNAKYSAAFERRYGSRPEIGVSLDAALTGTPDDRSDVVKLWHRALTGDTFSVTDICRDASGSESFYEIRYYPITDREGTPIAACQIARDISERKRYEDILLRQSNELRRSNAELEQFAYVASHDLQEPLRMVASYMQLLSERYHEQLDAKADKYIAYAVDGARRMQMLISDLLVLSRVNSRGSEPASVDCQNVVRQVLHDLEPTIRDCNGVVEVDALPTLLADEHQVAQLFQNLIGNALKFRGDRPPHIHVSAQAESGHWLFKVQDNGIGIAAEYAERVFVIFQRLHSREKYSGTGIGLAICKKIVERHHGRIWVESQPGEGATFYFTFPVAGSQTQANWQEAAATCA
jgi:PAS domain S-box-containing protein